MAKKPLSKEESQSQIDPSYVPRGEPVYENEENASAENLKGYYGGENSQTQAKPYYASNYVNGRKSRYKEYR